MKEKVKKHFVLAIKVTLLATFTTAFFTVMGMMCALFYKFLIGLSYNGQDVIALVVDKGYLPWLIAFTPVGFFGAMGWVYLNYPNIFLIMTITLSLSATVVVLYQEQRKQEG